MTRILKQIKLPRQMRYLKKLPSNQKKQQLKKKNPTSLPTLLSFPSGPKISPTEKIKIGKMCRES